jgi:hypothetical protein
MIMAAVMTDPAGAYGVSLGGLLGGPDVVKTEGRT